MKNNLTKRETATVLAALRLWQAYYGKNAKRPKEEWDDHFADCDPLSWAAINRLCEKINFGGK